jgi:integration host factor subunit alpha
MVKKYRRTLNMRRKLMEEKVTKIELTNNVYNKLDLTKEECYDIVSKFFEVIKEALARNETVQIFGMGKFKVKQKRARKGRNPSTGEDMEIAERKVLLFSLSSVLRDEINITEL